MIDNKDRAHAGRRLIVHDSQPLAVQPDLLEPQQADAHGVESLLMLDRRHRYVSIDESFCRLLGAPMEDLIGQAAGVRIGLDAYDEYIRPAIDRAFAGEVAAALLLTTHETLGTLRLTCICYPCLGTTGAVDYVLVRLCDTTVRNTLQQATLRRQQRQAAIHALDSALNTEAKIDAIGALAVHNLLEIVGCCTVTLRVDWRDSGVLRDGVEAPAGREVATAVTNSPQARPGERVVLPLQAQGVKLGELDMLLCEGKVLRGEVRNFVDAVTDRLTQALARDNMRAQIQQYTASLERIVVERTQEVTRRRHATMGIHDVLSMLIANEPLPVILDNIVRQAENMLAADAVAILEAQGKEGAPAFAPLVIDDPFSSVTPADLAAAQPLIDRAVQERQPLAGHSSEQPDHHDGRYRTHLVAPMVVANEVTGVTIYFFLANCEFTSDQIETAVVLSEQIFVAVASNRLQERAQEGAALKERERLASELHDAVTQSIYSLSLFAEAGRRLASIGKMERVQEYLQLLGETAQQAMKQLRLLLYELRPGVLEQIGLLRALQQRLDVVERRAGIDAYLEFASPFRLPPPVEDGLYRIAQEALNNALKHASAQAVTVRVRVDGDVVTLEVIDDGMGFDVAAEADENSIGIQHMHERAAALNADLVIESEAGKGTRVAVAVLVPGIGAAVNTTAALPDLG